MLGLSLKRAEIIWKIRRAGVLMGQGAPCRNDVIYALMSCSSCPEHIALSADMPSASAGNRRSGGARSNVRQSPSRTVIDGLSSASCYRYECEWIRYVQSPEHFLKPLKAMQFKCLLDIRRGGVVRVLVV